MTFTDEKTDGRYGKAQWAWCAQSPHTGGPVGIVSSVEGETMAIAEGLAVTEWERQFGGVQ